METLRILIADDETPISSCLSEMLRNLGHTVVAQASGGRDAVEKTSSFFPDLVIMDIKMDDMDGLEASKLILEEKPLPIVILTAFSDSKLIKQADAIGVSGYLIKPFTQNDLEPSITLARSRFKQLQELKREVVELRETIRSRKLIEQAKGLLMEKEGVTEAEAFNCIQQLSRNQNIPMVKIAEAVIMTSRVMKDKKNGRTASSGSRIVGAANAL